MNYSDLSDFEINKLVAKCEGFNLFKGCVTKSKSENWVRLTPYRNFDPCNNPSDAWPIILKNKISINCYKDGDSDYWESSSYDSKNNEKKRQFANDDKNPLRAAMIVYLMMEDAKNEV